MLISLRPKLSRTGSAEVKFRLEKGTQGQGRAQRFTGKTVKAEATRGHAHEGSRDNDRVV